MLFRIAGAPDEVDGIGKRPDRWLSVMDGKDTPVMMSCRQVISNVCGHALAVVGDENALLLLTPLKDGGIECAQRWTALRADREQVDGGFESMHGSHHRAWDVFIEQEPWSHAIRTQRTARELPLLLGPSGGRAGDEAEP